MEEKRVAVYCSSSVKVNPAYVKVAREFIRAASSYGYVIVSGGTVKGMMNDICEASAACGGKHIGIIPEMMKDLANPLVDELIVTGSMAERKAKMREGTIASVALPGGIGTLDEIVEALTLKKLGQYDGEIILFNYHGFYQPLLALLDHYVREGVMDQEGRQSVKAPETVEELVGILNSIV